jgi:hypothetical protein
MRVITDAPEPAPKGSTVHSINVQHQRFKTSTSFVNHVTVNIIGIVTAPLSIQEFSGASMQLKGWSVVILVSNNEHDILVSTYPLVSSYQLNSLR